ncbi:MAG: hypothetical protein HYW22_00830 [Candidatus Aenigmarchaeota archaeon]|nr:hypothetical protein [Candidatus Aenigmarchaeota archaeon]
MRTKPKLNVLSNAIKVLSDSKYSITAVVTAVIFAVIYSLAYGVFSIPPIFANLRTTPLELVDYLFIFASSVSIGIIFALSSYSISKQNTTGKGVSFGGLLVGLIGLICPACLGINLLVFGNVFSLLLINLIPYIRVVQLGAFALLGMALWFSVRNAYENYCIYCKVGEPTKLTRRNQAIDNFSHPVYKYLIYSMLIVTAIILVVQILPVFGMISISKPQTTNSPVDLAQVTSEVVPKEGFTLNATWGNVVQDMIKSGALDTNKLKSVLQNQYGHSITDDENRILTTPNLNEKITINSDNSVFVMYVLWSLGQHNNNTILSDSPIASYFDNYNNGVGKPGYSDMKLLSLTPEQQEIAKYVAENSYRPCCSNPTSSPDCSHGFSALGLVELMASQGHGKKDIFDSFVKANSFWFPSTYVQDAMYFKLAQNKDWSDVDRELVAGKDYSSLSGSYNVQNYLKSAGV